jgi:anion-transporting  ArsA/GET3 family ATPase
MLSTDLVLVSGKGGAGKSAVTAAIAIERARRGQTVLAIDLGSGSGLAAHLGANSLEYAPKEVRPGLSAMKVIRSEALDEYLKTQLHVPQGAPTKSIAAALSVLVDTAPGVREIISIGKPIFETWKGVWDAVVVDTPSLGQFQSYLRAPATISDLVRTGNVQRQAAAITDAITNPAVTKVVLVTNPAELPVIETLESIDIIARERLSPPPVVVMNRSVLSSSMGAKTVDLVPDGPYREAALHQQAIERMQDTWRSEIDYDVALPYLMGVLTPGEVALQLADSLVHL